MKKPSPHCKTKPQLPGRANADSLDKSVGEVTRHGRAWEEGVKAGYRIALRRARVLIYQQNWIWQEFVNDLEERLRQNKAPLT